MSYSHSVTHQLAGANPTIGGAAAYSASGEANFSESIAVGTDTFINIAIDISAVQSFGLCSDRAVQVETNATDHSGGNIITLKAGIPYIWTTDSYDTFKLTADVTGGFYVTNASGGTAIVECRCIFDSTP